MTRTSRPDLEDRHHDMAFRNLTSQIGTNYIPSEEELDHIKNSLLPAPTEKLASLEIEINRVHKLYSSLLEQRQALLDEIEGYRSLISPARRLPVDVLQEVFLHTLPTRHNALMDPQECPLLLTRICRGWRSIALSIPQLWASIHIPVPPIAKCDPPRWDLTNYLDLPKEFRVFTFSSLKVYATTISNWLGRSGASPLSITLYNPRSSSTPKEHYEIIINSFLQFANRWKNLILDTYSLYLGPIAQLTASDVPILESLTMHDTAHISNNDPLMWSRSELVKSPSLKRIDYTPVTDRFADFPLNWGQLTDLKLSNTPSEWGHPNLIATLSDIILVLSRSPRLISFHAQSRILRDSDVGIPSSISSLPLPNLQKLVYHDVGNNCRPLFELLNVPSLLHLEFIPLDGSRQTVLPIFLPRVAGTLLTLTTSHALFEPNHFPILSQCQKLTSIIIKRPVSISLGPCSPLPPHCLNDIFLENLTLPTDRSDRLAPALEVLECKVGGNFSDAALLKFIKAKQLRRDIAKLKRISIVFSTPGPDENDILLDDEVARYVADGLTVDLRYPVGLIINPKRPFAFRPDAGVPRPSNKQPVDRAIYYMDAI
ncbi:hypothetical protein M413DRAFT_371174 [Hebeloma cylindrosporum]|uniref:Uncharacterized protein n=1 Tax=Hebeloma cylindrosporum TaxID=76867 RepID=A0A0C2Y223_HEBCY|nr:hypothetical protein M413DRAFT_371174 [Hebeloma cylindrosporum h7]